MEWRRANRDIMMFSSLFWNGWWHTALSAFAILLAIVMVQWWRRSRMLRIEKVAARNSSATFNVSTQNFASGKVPADVELLHIVEGLSFSLARRAIALQTSERSMPRVLILDLAEAPAFQRIDLLALWEFFQECKSRHIRVVLCNLAEEYTMQLRYWTNADAFGHENLCACLNQAIVRAAVLIRMDGDLPSTSGQKWQIAAHTAAL